MSQFDEVADVYEDNLKELLRDNNTEKYSEYKINLMKLLTKKTKGKFLDFGCGVGRSFPYIKKIFNDYSIYGCDVSADSVKMACKYIPEDNLFINSDVGTLKCKGKMDLILAACVFHHIDPSERKEWIKAVVDALEDDGMFFIFEHNIKNPMTKRIVLDPLNLVDDINWMLTQKEIINIVNEIGNAKVVWKGYTLFSPWRPKWIMRLEMLLKWLPLGAQHCVVISKK